MADLELRSAPTSSCRALGTIRGSAKRFTSTAHRPVSELVLTSWTTLPWGPTQGCGRKPSSFQSHR